MEDDQKQTEDISVTQATAFDVGSKVEVRTLKGALTITPEYEADSRLMGIQAGADADGEDDCEDCDGPCDRYESRWTCPYGDCQTTSWCRGHASDHLSGHGDE